MVAVAQSCSSADPSARYSRLLPLAEAAVAAMASEAHSAMRAFVSGSRSCAACSNSTSTGFRKVTEIVLAMVAVEQIAEK
jgi:hypothetical protein